MAELDHERWRGVPIYMEAGKRLEKQIKDVIVTFRQKDSTVKPQSQSSPNRIIFSLEPQESIAIEFWAKKPGLGNQMELRTMDFMLRGWGQKTQYVEEYERLLVDAVRGDQTLFVSTSEVKSMWAFIDGIVTGWQKNLAPLKIYPPDTTPETNIF
jgi:glucose-6-phosphate 1-dehydrogenase